MESPVILWFKRDLRVVDHAALAHAARLGSVLPVYIVEPAYWSQPDVSGRHYAFLQECIDELRDQLAEIGLHLCLRVGEAVSVLEDLRVATGARCMVSHEETGNGWTYDRDRAVARWARGQGVIWEELAQSGVVRRLNGRDGWAAQRNTFLRQPLIAVQPVAPGPKMLSQDWPDLVAADACRRRQRGGRQRGLDLLESFLSTRGKDYRRAMSSPLTGEGACSRLSPHLALGTISGREAAQATADRQRAVRGTRQGWGGSLKSFQSRLAWRDHFMQKLEDEPELEHRCLHPAYEDLRPKDPDAALLAAWSAGETGIPFVDACMRYLAATGWLNFRMRSMLMAVASYHLWLDWRATGLHLARQFTDYEPGIHWPQVQMQSGTTGMNTIRIYNPVKQGRDQDPDGVFTRRWLPELEPVPDRYLQEPWRWEGASAVLGRSYPAPVVDVAAAARAARDKVWAVRQGAPFRDKAAELTRKHASRKDRSRLFVDDRTPRRAARKPDSRQMDFGF